MDTRPLRTILWLRWRLTRNQWARSGPLSTMISLCIAALVVLTGIAGGISGLVLGSFFLTKTKPLILLAIWDGLVLLFLFFWTTGLVTEIQRSETIDIRRLLHLPIGLRPLFILNYLASHVCFSMAMFLPGFLGLALGLAFGHSWRLLLMLPLALGFFFMVTAWTYCLRGWLVAIMVNPRRRRTVIAGVTMSFILVCQLPNLFTQFMSRQHQNKHTSKPVAVAEAPESVPIDPPLEKEDGAGIPPGLLLAHRIVPVLWLGNGALSLAQGHLGPSIWASLGLFGLGALGLRRAYYATLGFYLGQTPRKRIRKKPKPLASKCDSPLLLERSLPGIADETAALALTFFRSYLRAPEIKMMLGTNFIMLLFFSGMFLFRRNTPLPADIRPFGISGAVAITFFSMTQLMYNLFGPDRSGFRSLVLAPVPRHRILMGKNLALFPFVWVFGSLMVLLSVFALHLSPLYLICGFTQLGSLFLFLSIAGGLFSILLPYRIAQGSLKPTKMPGLIIVMQIVTHLLFPLIVAPIFLPPLLGLLIDKLGWSSAMPINLFSSGLVLLIAYAVYRLSLPRLGRLMQRHEQKILEVITKEVE